VSVTWSEAVLDLESSKTCSRRRGFLRTLFQGLGLRLVLGFQVLGLDLGLMYASS